MKLKSILLVVMALTSTANAQSLKFDELNITGLRYDSQEEAIEKRMRRFTEASVREKTLVPFVLHYRSRLRKYGDRKASDYAGEIRWKVENQHLMVLDGGVKETETLEFWFRSKTGELPKPTPAYERSEVVDCPDIGVYRQDLNFDRKLPIVFATYSYPEVNSRLKWDVKQAISGIASERVFKIDASKPGMESLDISVEWLDLPRECNSIVRASADVGAKPRLHDSFGLVPNGDMRGRLDNFLTKLSDSSLQGFVYLYGNRTEGISTLDARRRLISNHFLFRKVDLKRITIIDAGYRETVATDIWLVPTGAQPPIPTPSVDRRFVSKGKPVKRSRK